MIELSQAKKHYISNICYANVSMHFSSMCNPKFRGPRFKWENFVSMMVNFSKDWAFIYHVRGHKALVNHHFAQYTKEIAERMLDNSGFLKNDE